VSGAVREGTWCKRIEVETSPRASAIRATPGASSARAPGSTSGGATEAARAWWSTARAADAIGGRRTTAAGGTDGDEDTGDQQVARGSKEVRKHENGRRRTRADEGAP